jgi:hypothetical protein
MEFWDSEFYNRVAFMHSLETIQVKISSTMVYQRSSRMTRMGWAGSAQLENSSPLLGTGSIV